jgi:hypothetical protein
MREFGKGKPSAILCLQRLYLNVIAHCRMRFGTTMRERAVSSGEGEATRSAY